jgi:hypothetical protein
MNQRKAKKERRQTVKQVNSFLENIWKLPFGARLKIAWRMVRGKKSK